jgi:hypothetical protein
VRYEKGRQDRENDRQYAVETFLTDNVTMNRATETEKKRNVDNRQKMTGLFHELRNV